MYSRFALFLLLFISHFSFSQLSVRNDTYIFISDEIVFVEDDINLNEADSRIYLRSEGQVIQGTGVTGNSGVGELSVYQEGNVGAHEYNYWCSPVGTTTSSAINNPNGATLLNDVTGLITSTPATVGRLPGYNGTSSPLAIESRWIWKFIASDDYAEWVYVGANTSVNPGEGFTMKGTSGSGDAQQYDFRGKPNNGTISVTVADGQLSLVGNPYPSALDARDYIHDVENAAVITGTLQFWEQDPTVDSHYVSSYDGGYATYTIDATGTVPTYVAATFSTYTAGGAINGSGSGSPSGKQPGRYIPIGQGFMVEGIAAGTVKAKNSHREFVQETDPDSEFFKNADGKTKKTSKTTHEYFQVPDDFKRFRLNIDFNDTYTRQLLETFHNSATKGFDYGLETKLNGADVLASDAYWSIDDKPYFNAEALPYDLDVKIPLTITVADDSEVRIRIADIQNFDSDQPIYLHDKDEDIYVDLRSQDFNIGINAAEYSNRFEITFKKATTLNTVNSDLEGLSVFQNNSISELKISNPNSLEISNFSLVDVSGKEIKKEIIKNAQKEASFSTKTLSEGVYIVSINLEDNRTINKKIVITNK